MTALFRISISWILLFSSLTLANVQRVEPLRASNELDNWAAHIKQTAQDLKKQKKYPETGYAECAETLEIKDAFLCFYDDPWKMNLALARASFYSEGGGGVTAGTLIRFSSPTYQRSLEYIAGHDIPSPALLEFYAKANEACAQKPNDADICPSQSEKDVFENFILPVAKQEGHDFVVITTSLDPKMSYIEIASHEILHAQYFLEPVYRNTVDHYWHDVLTENQRQDVRTRLYDYDTNNDFVMRNEFQAYLLMAGATQAQLGDLVPELRPPLEKLLTENGVPPVQVTGKGSRHTIHGKKIKLREARTLRL